MISTFFGLVALLATSGPDVTAPCRKEPGRNTETFRGEVQADSTYQHTVAGGRFIVRLLPIEYGWILRVYERGRPNDDLSALTPPWHFVPNPREIEGWHFRNADNTGPPDGTVNAPDEWREFIFSPDVGRTIAYNGSNTTMEEVDRVEAYGRAVLHVLEYRLSPPESGERARFEWIKFQVCVSWPKSKP